MISAIKKFFNTLFLKNKINKLDAPSNIDNSNDLRKNFVDEMKSTSEDKRIMELQLSFSNGDITEEEISNEDKEELIKLYESQIEQVEKSIEDYKNKILKIKNELKLT